MHRAFGETHDRQERLIFSRKEAGLLRRPSYLLFVRGQTVITVEDRRRRGASDEEASGIFHHAKEKMDGKAAVLRRQRPGSGTLVEVAATVGASRLMPGAPKRSSLLNQRRGNMVRDVSDLLPEEMERLVFARADGALPGGKGVVPGYLQWQQSSAQGKMFQQRPEREGWQEIQRTYQQRGRGQQHGKLDAIRGHGADAAWSPRRSREATRQGQRQNG